VLGVLRVAEVVRYQMDGRRNRYRLKHPSEVRGVLSALKMICGLFLLTGSQ
jgi:hypothetical protein